MRIAVIGAGFGGLSAAATLAQAGHDVTVFEKNDQPGGRARVLRTGGYVFDLGPSWYIMPDIYEEFFAQFGKKPSDYYELKELIPSYRAYFEDGPLDIHPAPAAYKDFDDLEPGAGVRLGELLDKTKHEYEMVRKQLLGARGQLNIRRFLQPAALKMLFTPELELPYHGRIARYVHDPRLQKILEYMVVFMGGSPRNIPAFYTLLTWVDFGLRIHYPMGGFGAVAQAFENVAREQGATFVYNAPVEHITVAGNRAASVRVNGTEFPVDAVLANADYHHVESALLDRPSRSYSASYWQNRTMSPSAVVAALGVRQRLPLEHHNLFFDAPGEENFKAMFDEGRLHDQPLFYACSPSQTDPTVAPQGHENVFILIPVTNVEQPAEAYERLVDHAIERIEHQTGRQFKDDIVHRQVLGHSYFTDTFNAFQGNSFGLAHTRTQIGLLRPRIRSKKVRNLYFAGQMTNPGTGVPLVILSGQVAAKTLMRYSK